MKPCGDAVTDRDACIILNMLPGIGSARLDALLQRFGSPSAILEQPVSELEQVKNIPAKLAEKIAAWHKEVDLEKELSFTEKAGVKIITRYEDDFPAPLNQIFDPPICLYVRGHLPDCSSNSVAVVGSRRMSIYGRKMARHLSEAAAYAGWKVISGLAYGVDAEAHQATLDAGGITVAVLGGGLARIHPQDHTTLAREICERGGALVSEYPMNFPVSRQSFPRRNRIISGLSQAVLVVEAGLNSGAMLTANIALEQGRSVFAVPGQADNPQAQGCHQLIKNGAKLTETFDDVMEDFEFLPGFGSVREEEQAYTPDLDLEIKNIPFEGLEDNEQLIVQTLADGEKSLDQLSGRTGIQTGKLLSLMMKLEIRKLVKQLPGQLFSLSR